jgi:Eukaryotic aspartyl protease
LGGLAIQNQAVECAKKVSSTFATRSGDGLLGLAFDVINTVKPHAVPTPVQNLRNEGLTPKVIPNRL